MTLINRFAGGVLIFVMGHVVVADGKSQAETVMVKEITQILKDLTQHPKMGGREAGTEQERHTAAYIKHYFTDLGYQVKGQPFTFKAKGISGTSENVITERVGISGKVLVIGAHYDSAEAAKGSTGATDNGSGVAAMLLLAKHFAQIKPEITLRFIAFGAEEIGLQGSRYYVRKLPVSERKNILGMINFDTIAGGDKLYIHSADKRPYRCDRNNTTGHIFKYGSGSVDLARIF